MNQKQIAEKFLGDTNPNDFDSIQEIEDYFHIENIKSMFGNEDIDPTELDIAKSYVLHNWDS